MPNRIPTKGIPTPAVRVSKSAQPAAKPAAKPAMPNDKAINKAESMFKKMKPSGDIAKDKAAVAKKTGVWPNGDTN